jgi:peptide/nickel transport system substrate-binding protein
MVGSGPYRFLPAEFNPGSRAVYEKFTGYVPRQEAPDWATGAKIAHFDRLEWIMIPDASTAASALRAGEVDWWERPTPDLLPLLKTDRRVTLQPLNQLGQTGVIRLNCLQPPFNNVAVRRAMLMSVVQEDYMRAVNGDDNDAWTTCYSLYPRGTPYYSEDGAALLKGPHDSATVHAALQAAGYAGEKVVILNPTDFPTIGPFGEVAFDALKRAGMNVELAESDWGTVVQRRTNRGPVDKGGWSLFSTYATVTGVINPAVSPSCAARV